DLSEEVYIEQPPGFVAQEEPSNIVCRLHTSYGLKQSSRAWFDRFSTVVQQFVCRSELTFCLYRHSAQGCIYLI
nr:retrotransposon peptide {Ty1-copia retrotransposon element, clone Sat 11} [Vicia sativa, leaves, Peptide Transposon Partial, 73 aa] [Vicia sativa]